MLKEIYCRNSDDPGYRYTQLETSNALEALLTKIRMIIFTSRGDVLGDYDFGLDLERLLFQLNFSANDVIRNFNAQIAKYVPEARSFKIDVEINFVPGTVRDIAYIDIYIDGSKYLGVIVT